MQVECSKTLPNDPAGSAVLVHGWLEAAAYLVAGEPEPTPHASKIIKLSQALVTKLCPSPKSTSHQAAAEGARMRRQLYLHITLRCGVGVAS